MLKSYQKRIEGKITKTLIKENEELREELPPKVRKKRKAVKKAKPKIKKKPVIAPKTAPKEEKVLTPEEQAEKAVKVALRRKEHRLQYQRDYRKRKKLEKGKLATPEQLEKVAIALEYGLDEGIDKVLSADIKELVKEVPFAPLPEPEKPKKKRKYYPKPPRPKRKYPCWMNCGEEVDRHQTRCKNCQIKRATERQKYQKAWRYGMTPEIYIKLLDIQNWQCKVCAWEFDETRMNEVTFDTSSDGVKFFGFTCRNCHDALTRMRQGKLFKSLPESLIRWLEYEQKNFPENNW